jgi:ATP-dependent DNA helicase RecQ
MATIEGHLAHYVSNGELKIDQFVSAAKLQAIEEKISGMRGKPLKKIKAALDDNWSYGEIKMVLAHLDRGE